MLLVVLACMKPAAPVRVDGPDALRSELAVDGPIEARLAQDDAHLVVLYGGEERGSLAPCGCADRPRGGLPRQQAYRREVDAQTEAPVVVVDVGAWLEDAIGLDGEPRPDVPTLNQWMAEGMRLMGPSALNVAFPDAAGLEGTGPVDLPLVSAHVTGPGVTTTRVISEDPRVVVTGITRKGVTLLDTPSFAVEDPLPRSREVLTQLRAEDPKALVVLLAHQAPEEAKALAEEGLVDVVIDANLHRTHDPPFRVGEAVWVKSHLQTMRQGELRLWLEDGRVVRVVDRKVDLDQAMPDDPAMLDLSRSAQRDIERVQTALYGRPLAAE